MSLIFTQEFYKNTETDQNLTFPFRKHKIFDGAAHGAKTYFHITDNKRVFFFSHAQEVKGCVFHEKNIQKILLDLFRN